MREEEEKKEEDGGRSIVGSRGQEIKEQGEESRGGAFIGSRSNDTAHPSQWQVPAVAPLQRTQTKGQGAALSCDNTTESGC